MSGTMWPMAILVALAAISVAFETPVRPCCPPGQFLAIEDWQESRQTVEGMWFSQNPAGINHPTLATLIVMTTTTQPKGKVSARESLLGLTTNGCQRCRWTTASLGGLWKTGILTVTGGITT